MKKIFELLALMVPFFAVSCVEDLVNPGEDISQKEKVTITLHTSAATKTMLVDEKSVKWENGDVVIINGERYEVRVDESNTDVAYVDGVTPAETYTAFYNYTWYAPLKGGDILLTIPYSQYYREGSFGQFENAMVAHGEMPDLYFYNATSIIRIGVLADTEDVALKSVTITGNGNENVSGLFVVTAEQLADLENFDGMKYQESVMFEGQDYEQTAPSRNSVNVVVDTLSLSQVEPTYIYAVVAPQTFETGITVTLEDMNGRVCIQSTDKKLVTKRSGITPMADFVFSSSDVLTVDVNSVSSDWVGFEGTAKKGAQIAYCLMYKSAWEAYATDYADATETEMARDFLNKYGTLSDILDGKFELGTSYASNLVNPDLVLFPETDYKFMVSYATKYGVVGSPIVVDVRTTAAPEGEAPEFEPVLSLNGNRAYINVYLSDNVEVLSWVWSDKASMEDLRQSYSSQTIMELWGGSVYSYYFTEAEDGRRMCSYYYELEYGREYTFYFRAGTKEGAVSFDTFEFRVPELFEGQWETYSTTASMSCNFLSVLGVSENLPLENLTVEKLAGKDCFRVHGIFNGLNQFFEEGVFGLSEDDCLYIDATVPDNVTVAPSLTYAYYEGQPLYFYSASYVSDGYAVGHYNKETGEIVLGDLVAEYGENLYLLGGTTPVLYMGNI